MAITITQAEALALKQSTNRSATKTSSHWCNVFWQENE